MTDHHDAPGLPTSDETTALALLDARCRHAAASLRTALDVPAAADPVEVAPFPDRPRRRRVWLVAAALLVVAGLVAALALRRSTGGEDDGMVSSDQPAYLVPGWTPDGWHIQEARTIRADDFSDKSTGTIAVYGDSRLADPWSGPRLSVARLRHRSYGPGPGGERLTIGGHDASIVAVDDLTQVSWSDGDVGISVVGEGAGMDRSVVVPAAEALAAGEVDDGLPTGFVRLAEGPSSVVVGPSVDVSSGHVAIESFWVQYAEAAPGTGRLTVVQQPGDRDDMELLRASDQLTRTEVQGRPAYRFGADLPPGQPSPGERSLEWYEPSTGLIVTVYASEVDPSVLTRFAEGLRPGGPHDVDALRSSADAGPFGALEPGEIPVTEGEYPNGAPWRLVAADHGNGDFELVLTDDTGTSSVRSTPDLDDGKLTVGRSPGENGGMVLVYGAMAVQAGAVTIEVPGREPIPLTWHESARVPGWIDNFFWGLVPADLPPGEVVTTTTVGDAEFARVPLDLGG
jgi:hypothetical protein